jgi:hypothetical protein
MEDLSGRIIFRDREVAWSTCFSTDLSEIYTDELRRRGYRPPSSVAVDELGRLFHDWRRLRLEAFEGCQLRVHYSANLDAEREHPAVKEIAKRACNGEALWPYTSTRTRKPRFNDDMLNDWGIVHFHLGDTFGANGHVKGTKALLFAQISAEDMYLLAVRDHDSFEDRELLNIAICNWPEAFERYRIIGATIDRTPAPSSFAASARAKGYSRTVLVHPTRAVSDEQTKSLRNLGLTATFEAKTGAHYYAPGGGYSCTGTSLVSREYADHEIWWAGRLAKTIEAEILQIATRLSESASNVDPAELKFRLRSLEEMKRALIVEESTNRGIQLPLDFDYAFDPIPMLKMMAAAAMA